MVNDAIMYAEVFEILKYMDKQEVMKIPVNILELIKNERDKKYITKVDKNDVFNPDNVDRRSINLLVWLAFTYMGNEEEKKEIIRIGNENDKRREEENRLKLSIEKNKTVEVEKEKKQDVLENMNEDKNLVVVKESNSLFTRIIKFIKNIFNC